MSVAELTCKQLEIMIVDSATKAVEDQAILIETFGNASAQYVIDFTDANLALTNLDAAVSTRATQTSVDTVDSNVDAILVDTNEMQGKLPT